MSNKNLSLSTNSGKCSTFMNSHQKLPKTKKTKTTAGGSMA